jgi:hypothetical protein
MLMVRDGASAPPHQEGQKFSSLARGQLSDPHPCPELTATRPKRASEVWD